MQRRGMMPMWKFGEMVILKRLGSRDVRVNVSADAVLGVTTLAFSPQRVICVESREREKKCEFQNFTSAINYN